MSFLLGIDDFGAMLLVSPFIGAAIAGWGFCVYCWFRCFSSLPSGRWTIPLFSRDPRYISAEGIVWRKRLLLGGVVFILGCLLAVALAALTMPRYPTTKAGEEPRSFCSRPAHMGLI